MTIKEELRLQQEELRLQQEEFETIKNILNDKSEKVDITNMYVINFGRIIYFVSASSSELYCFPKKEFDDYFNNNIHFSLKERNYPSRICGTKVICGSYAAEYEDNCSYYPIEKVSKVFLLYPDKKVPIEVLMKVYYQLNNVDVRTYQLKK